MSSADTTEIIRRFNDAFQRHDGSVFRDLVGEGCVIENSTPAPDGARIEGRDACAASWTQIATSPEIEFDLEDVEVMGERAIIRWRMRRGAGAVRGVNLMRVRAGKIVEGMGYVKGQ